LAQSHSHLICFRTVIISTLKQNATALSALYFVTSASTDIYITAIPYNGIHICGKYGPDLELRFGTKERCVKERW